MAFAWPAGSAATPIITDYMALKLSRQYTVYLYQNFTILYDF